MGCRQWYDGLCNGGPCQVCKYNEPVKRAPMFAEPDRTIIVWALCVLFVLVLGLLGLAYIVLSVMGAL